ncbi:unnamed protein product [Gongylonema pulchrum]|uniref:Programmed cell death protein 2 n=1 Tax=Gongylonema pulchrum TaxID=637853 RepID=A0A183D7W1_9BILA|nr:unnamed protein product [Gongylonema pulchrum]
MSAKRQPIYEEKAVEKKKRRKTQKTGGTRGPHVQDDDSAGSSGIEGDSSGYEQEVSALISNMIVNTNWRKEVRDLWSNSPPNLFAEKDFNKRISCKAPHCAVCQYFVPKPLMEKKKTLPMKSVTEFVVLQRIHCVCHFFIHNFE